MNKIASEILINFINLIQWVEMFIVLNTTQKIQIK